MIKSNFSKLLALGLVSFLFACNSDDSTTDDNRILPNDYITPLIKPSGFYIVNEDWYGHDEGTVNFIDQSYHPFYRVYRENNPGKKFGVTTQSATTYGDYYYFISKQQNRLVVTDKNLKEVLTLEDINGDGRAFVGATKSKGYISTSKGITVFDIDNLKVDKTLTGINTQVGNMAVINNKLYAVGSNNTLYIIDINTDNILKQYTDKYSQLTIDGKGIVWVGNGDQLVKINPFNNDEMTNIPINGTSIEGQWGAWNPGSLTASTDGKYVYWNANGGAWNGGNTIAQFDVDNNTLNPNFYKLGQDENVMLEFYGAGMRIDPHTNNLVLTVKRKGWGSNGSYNWVQIIGKNGGLLKNIKLSGGTDESTSYNPDGGYFWFPAQPLFEDNNAPQITANQFIVKTNTENRIALKDFVIDQDSPFNLIQFKISNRNADLAQIDIENELGGSDNNELGKHLVIKTNNTRGKTHISIEAISNGKAVTKEIQLIVQ